MQKAYEIVQPGMTEIEAVAEIEYELRRAGAWGYAFETLLASGPRTAYCHGYSTEKKIEKGEGIWTSRADFIKEAVRSQLKNKDIIYWRIPS